MRGEKYKAGSAQSGVRTEAWVLNEGYSELSAASYGR